MCPFTTFASLPISSTNSPLYQRLSEGFDLQNPAKLGQTADYFQPWKKKEAYDSGYEYLIRFCMRK
jgi:hypothetical protein